MEFLGAPTWTSGIPDMAISEPVLAAAICMRIPRASVPFPVLTFRLAVGTVFRL